MIRRASTRLLPAVLLIGSAGCFATKNDIRLLQEELRASRAAASAADAARRAQADSLARVSAASSSTALARIEAMLRSQGDSLRSLSARADALQVSMTEQLRANSQEINRLAALTAQLPNVTREFRSTLEEMIMRAPPPPPITDLPVPVDTTLPPASIPPGLPGPNQLMQQGLQSLRGGSCRGARQTLQDIVTYYPTYDQMPLVLQMIAESYHPCDGNSAAADSVYAVVVAEYPRSQEAGTALYRRALILEEARRQPEARALFERVIREYPMSDAARLACQKLGRSNC